jgi:hypothetical protein
MSVVKGSEQCLSLVRERSAEAGPWLQDYINGLAPADLIGDGFHKVVYPYGDNHVAAFYTRPVPPSLIKLEYYSRKLFHTFFPGLIPDIKLASSKPPLLIVERVDGITVFEHSLYLSSQEDSRRRALNAIDNTKKTLNQFGNIIDTKEDNFIVTKDGNAYYVDGIFVNAADRKALLDEARTLPSPRKDKAIYYLNRLDLI